MFYLGNVHHARARYVRCVRAIWCWGSRGCCDASVPPYRDAPAYILPHHRLIN